MPKLTVCLLTYERTAYAEQALYTTLDKLHGDAELHVHIADDGSSQKHRDALYNVAKQFALHQVTMSNSEQGGYGRNFNLAMQAIHPGGGYVLPLEDDWVLTRSLNVDPLIRALDAGIGVECIRLGYLSFTQALFGRVMSAPPEWYKYLLLDPDSAEPHVFAGHPRLETVEYERRVGPWPEGLPPGQTEFTVAHWPAARRGVAWPMDLLKPTIEPLFAHIGSVRSTEVEAHPEVTHA